MVSFGMVHTWGRGYCFIWIVHRLGRGVLFHLDGPQVGEGGVV